jgi:uncharacterized heparinase superfamily protein
MSFWYIQLVTCAVSLKNSSVISCAAVVAVEDNIELEALTICGVNLAGLVVASAVAEAMAGTNTFEVLGKLPVATSLPETVASTVRYVRNIVQHVSSNIEALNASILMSCAPVSGRLKQR